MFITRDGLLGQVARWLSSVNIGVAFYHLTLYRICCKSLHWLTTQLTSNSVKHSHFWSTFIRDCPCCSVFSTGAPGIGSWLPLACTILAPSFLRYLTTSCSSDESSLSVLNSLQCFCFFISELFLMAWIRQGPP